MPPAAAGGGRTSRAQPAGLDARQPEHLQVHLPDRLGCFTHTRSGALLLGLQLPGGAQALDTQAVGEHTLGAEACRWSAPVEADTPSTRVNDGRCDRAGNFVFGTLDEAEPRQAIAHYYQYSNAHGLRCLALPPVRIANSTCFQPRWPADLFLRLTAADHLGLRRRCRLRPSRRPARLCPVARPQRDPDGSGDRRRGLLVECRWGTGTVVRYAPKAASWPATRPMPAHTTCPALGGLNGDELMVSSARVGRERRAAGGAAFVRQPVRHAHPRRPGAGRRPVCRRLGFQELGLGPQPALNLRLGGCRMPLQQHRRQLARRLQQRRILLQVGKGSNSAPLWREPMNSPGPRISRSRRAIRSCRSSLDHGLSQAFASVRQRCGVNQHADTGLGPAPDAAAQLRNCASQSALRARSPSGWRWARPRPPITVVLATSTLIVPPENSDITAAFLARHAAVQQATIAPAASESSACVSVACAGPRSRSSTSGQTQ